MRVTEYREQSNKLKKSIQPEFIVEKSRFFSMLPKSVSPGPKYNISSAYQSQINCAHRAFNSRTIDSENRSQRFCYPGKSRL